MLMWTGKHKIIGYYNHSAKKDKKGKVCIDRAIEICSSPISTNKGNLGPLMGVPIDTCQF